METALTMVTPDNFTPFARMTANAFQKVANSGAVFVVDVSGDEMYATYLGAFPEGTYPGAADPSDRQIVRSLRPTRI
jgi:hypothetical protein